MIEKLREYLAGLTDEEKLEIAEDLRDKTPKGWLSIEDHLPMMNAMDLLTGGTIHKVKFKNGKEGKSIVGDHNTWYYGAKEQGITHWYNE